MAASLAAVARIEEGLLEAHSIPVRQCSNSKYPLTAVSARSMLLANSVIGAADGQHEEGRACVQTKLVLCLARPVRA
jgi:hypothetical protein